MWVQDQAKKLKRSGRFYFLTQKESQAENICDFSEMCVGVRTNLNGSFRLDSHNRNSYGFGLYCSPFVRVFTAAKSAKAYVTRSPVQSPNTNKKPSAQGLEGKHSSPFQRSRVTDSLKFWCSVLIYVSWLRKMDWPRMLASFSWQCQLVSGRNGSHDDHLPLIKGKKKFFFLCVGPTQDHFSYFSFMIVVYVLRMASWQKKTSRAITFRTPLGISTPR